MPSIWRTRWSAGTTLSRSNAYRNWTCRSSRRPIMCSSPRCPSQTDGIMVRESSQREFCNTITSQSDIWRTWQFMCTPFASEEREQGPEQRHREEEQETEQLRLQILSYVLANQHAGESD